MRIEQHKLITFLKNYSILFNTKGINCKNFLSKIITKPKRSSLLNSSDAFSYELSLSQIDLLESEEYLLNKKKNNFKSSLALSSNTFNIISSINQLSEKELKLWKQELGQIYCEFRNIHSVTSLWGSFCIAFVIYGTMNGCLGSLRHVLEVYHTAETLDLIFVIYFTLSFALMPICDFIYCKFKILTAESVPIGSLIFALGQFFLFIFWKKKIGLFVSVSILMALGTSMLASPAMSSIGTWFNKHLGKAQSLVTIGGGIGAIIMPYMINTLVIKKGPFVAFFCLFVLCLLFLTMGVFFVKDNHRYLIEQEMNERERILKTQNIKQEQYNDIDQNFRFKIFFKHVKEILRAYGIDEPSFICVILASTLAENCIGFFQLNLELVLSRTGVRENSIKDYYAIMQGAGVIGRLTFGILADFLIHPNIIQSVSLVISVLITTFFWIPNLFHSGVKLIIVLITQGFIFNGIYSITATCISRVSEKKDFAKRYSFLYMIESLACFPIFHFLTYKLKKEIVVSFQSINILLIIAAVISIMVPFFQYFNIIWQKINNMRHALYLI